MVDTARFMDTVSLQRQSPPLIFLFYLGTVDFASCKDTVSFVTPMSTLELLYLCKVDFANIKDTVWLQRQSPPLIFCIFVRSTLQTLISF